MSEALGINGGTGDTHTTVALYYNNILRGFWYKQVRFHLLARTEEYGGEE